MKYVRYDYEDMIKVLSLHMFSPEKYGWDGKEKALEDLYCLVEKAIKESTRKVNYMKAYRASGKGKYTKRQIEKNKEAYFERF